MTIVDGHPFVNTKNHASKGISAEMPKVFKGKRDLSKSSYDKLIDGNHQKTAMSYGKKRSAK